MKRTQMPPRKTGLKATTMRASGKRMRSSKPKMTPARSNARGKPCMVRIPGVCNGDPETTVLAHYRLAGYCGVGMKPIDALGAWACSACHDECDRRTRKMESDFVRLAHAEGVMRTLAEIERSGE
jgi:hypothetical protein